MVFFFTEDAFYRFPAPKTQDNIIHNTRRRDKTGQDGKTRQDKTRTRQLKTTQGNTTPHNTNEDETKTKRNKTRHERTGQNKAGQDQTRLIPGDEIPPMPSRVVEEENKQKQKAWGEQV